MDENTKTQEAVVKKKIWSFWKKVSVFGLLAVVAIFGLLIWVGNNTRELTKKIENWKAERYEQALQEYTDEMKAKYTADTDGGKTPEETIDLFIETLKTGDIEKASKYYVLEKQEEALSDLKDELVKYGDLHLSTEYFVEVSTKGIKGCNEKKDGCAFEYEYIREKTSTTTAVVSGQNLTLVSPAGSSGRKIIEVALNKFSRVWKIELP